MLPDELEDDRVFDFLLRERDFASTVKEMRARKINWFHMWLEVSQDLKFIYTFSFRTVIIQTFKALKVHLRESRDKFEDKLQRDRQHG